VVSLSYVNKVPGNYDYGEYARWLHTRGLCQPDYGCCWKYSPCLGIKSADHGIYARCPKGPVSTEGVDWDAQRGRSRRLGKSIKSWKIRWRNKGTVEHQDRSILAIAISKIALLNIYF